MSKLIEIAQEERGILYKLLQQLYPEKIPAHQLKTKSLSKAKIIAIIEKDLNLKFNEHFNSISEAVFYASVGQVHKAELKKNEFRGLQVAIKIQYPGVKQSIKSQLNFLKLAAKSANFSPIAKWKIATNEHIIQIEKKLDEELNYKHELSNLLKFQSLNKTNRIQPIEEYCSSTILTQTWLVGSDLNYVEKNWSQIQKKKAAELLLEGFLKQILVDGFFQSDTNFSNFIFEEDQLDIKINWIDFGNWVNLPLVASQSFFSLIIQTLKNEKINYLGHFERIGFDLEKLKYLQNSLPIIVSILFEPFLTNRPYDLETWNIEERMNNLLGENKWWFRSSGTPEFLELMKSFYGIIKIIKHLHVNINWQTIFLKYVNTFDTKKIDIEIPEYQNSIPDLETLAKKLIIEIFKNSKEHVKIELPATSLLDLENLIPEETKLKLSEKLLDISKIKFSYLEKGLVPGEVFFLETNEQNVNTKFRVFLT